MNALVTSNTFKCKNNYFQHELDIKYYDTII